MDLNPKELTPCKISHICRCAFNELAIDEYLQKLRKYNTKVFGDEKNLKIGEICSFRKIHQKLTHMQKSCIFEKFSFPS